MEYVTSDDQNIILSADQNIILSAHNNLKWGDVNANDNYVIQQVSSTQKHGNETIILSADRCCPFRPPGFEKFSHQMGKRPPYLVLFFASLSCGTKKFVWENTFPTKKYVI